MRDLHTDSHSSSKVLRGFLLASKETEQRGQIEDENVSWNWQDLLIW